MSTTDTTHLQEFKELHAELGILQHSLMLAEHYRDENARVLEGSNLPEAIRKKLATSVASAEEQIADCRKWRDAKHNEIVVFVSDTR